MAYGVFHSLTFDRELNKFPKETHEWLAKIESQLETNPYVGDPLGVCWFREKKHGKIRFYYLIYEECKAVYFVAISEKKDKQRVINTIWLLMENFKEEIKKLIQN